MDEDEDDDAVEAAVEESPFPDSSLRYLVVGS